MISFATTLSVGKWIYYAVKHIFLGHRSLNHYWETKRVMTLMFIVLITVSIIAALLAVMVVGSREDEKESHDKPTKVITQRDEKTNKSSSNKETSSEPPPNKRYGSQEHGDFVLDYFNEIKQQEKKVSP